MLPQHLYCMVFHFGEECTCGFRENSWQNERRFCSLKIHCWTCMILVWTCAVWLQKFSNWMKWWWRIFEQHKRFISWSIYRTSRLTYALCKIQIWVQTSSNIAKKSTKFLPKKQTNRGPENKKRTDSLLIPWLIFIIQTKLIIFEIAKYFANSP